MDSWNQNGSEEEITENGQKCLQYLYIALAVQHK